jgi:hypothetical protein
MPAEKDAEKTRINPSPLGRGRPEGPGEGYPQTPRHPDVEKEPAENENPGLLRLERLHALVIAMEDAHRRGDTTGLAELCRQATAAAKDLTSGPLPPEALADLEELHAMYAKLCLGLTLERQETQQEMARLRQGIKTLKVYRQD